ncbi:glycerate kinase [Corynebacterium durum]|mgnify:FL=1|uniref:glycerate kinase n=1 Tax=Corynebacterium durum TaxID=61592 RepID=UPI0026DB6BFE|nr:glycerate kinase [Corynebacterium durum]MDO4653585.1 glycerate kinase [Corynebacterium durum]
MTTIVIAPDAFKGTATTHDAAAYLAEGIAEALPDAELVLVPMADGGEGTASCFDGTPVTLPTTDAAGRLTEATYMFNDGDVAEAYIDVAAASGLPAVADHPVPLTGDTYGTGVLIADAVTRGAQRIILGLGGTATVDGGTGILVALGATPQDKAGHPLRPGGGSLTELAGFDTAQLNIPAAAVEWVLLTDVTNPATGPDGAAAVFGPQKGATPEDITLLDAALAQLCDICEVDPTTPGFGAAGGLPIGITWLSTLMHGNHSHIHVLPGARMVAESVGLPELMQSADLVVTGEGRFDKQSTRGKVVGTVLDMAVAADVPVVVVAGSFQEKIAGQGVSMVELSDNPDVKAQLVEAGRRIAAMLP